MWLLGIVIGFILGAIALQGFGGGLAGGLVGFIVALALRSHARTIELRAKALHPVAPLTAPGDADAGAATVAARVAAMEERLRRIEARLDGPVAGPTTPAPTHDIPAPVALPMTAPQPTPLPASISASAPRPAQIDVPLMPPAATIPQSPEGWVQANDGTVQPANTVSVAPEIALPESPRPLPTPTAPNPLWVWFTGGNALTRIGVVVLFFGVGFLLKYFAHYFTIPIELRLSGVALLGAGLIALGIKLQGNRPGYGLSLQGAGAGILYLTAFAAFRYYDVLPATAAFVLLATIATLTVWLAIRNESQPLAGLAIAGGFLAPFLVDAHTGGPALLFGYFAVLNAAIFAVAWLRAWRALNVVGFLFTFVLGMFWGHQYYTPEYFATVEPFLILFFAFYVAIAVLYAKKAPLAMHAPVDALLVFGVPLVGFALQAGLVRDTRYGVAWSAFAVAAVYGMLFAVLRKCAEPGFALLSRAFLALAIIFATIAIPFAADPQWTSAWWALEAAAVYWIGCEQRQGLARAFALLLQVGAATALVLGGLPQGGQLFLNVSFLGTALLATAGLATSWVADRAGDRISANEHALSPLIFGWGLLWWIGGGAFEILRHLPRGEEENAVLAFVTVSAAAALWLRRWLRWSRLAWFGAALLPAMAVVALKDWQHARTTLLAWGWLIWPVAWITHWFTLRAAETLRGGEALKGNELRIETGFLHFLHTASAIALVAWTSWEASEWVGRYLPDGTVWMACAAAWPAIAYLGLTVRSADSTSWPFADYRDAYATNAGTTVAALLGVWFAIVNVVSPGTAAPLPYIPLANPLDVTFIATLAALWSWARRFGRFDERTLHVWFGAAVFLFVNGIVFRTMHQWADVPWRWSALLASKPLQAALTLTWTATALPLMVTACRRSIRPLWMAGAALLAIVVAKLFLLDLAALSGLPRVVAFLGVGALLLLIGYLAPLPPAISPDRESSAR